MVNANGYPNCPSSTLVLTESEWQTLRQAHERRVDAWTVTHQQRAARGEKHPVWDFFFSYYAFRPAWLRQWHPGPDVMLSGAGADLVLRWPEYERTNQGMTLRLERFPEKRRDFVRWLRELLGAVQTRPAFFGCFGLHEWAMVYRQSAEALRHNTWPLRFGPDALAAIVERNALCCTHFDAFRFFTPPAWPLNRHALAREAAPQFEQRGCLHANMDLYKWAFKLAPFTPSGLVADCFSLARDIREIDMRASPYDLRALGFEPIAIETQEGRTVYEHHQREFAALGEPLRLRLIALCNRLVAN